MGTQRRVDWEQREWTSYLETATSAERAFWGALMRPRARGPLSAGRSGTGRDGPVPAACSRRVADAMERADLIALAAPSCHECGAPVQRVETRWHLDEDCRWRPGPYFMVCGDEHRVLVEPLE